MALSRVVSEIFNVEKCRDLEIGVRGHSRSLKVVPFVRSCMVSLTFLLVFFSNFVHGRRHGFECGGTILRAERVKKNLTPPLFGQWGGGQNIA